jgi:Transmembrane domain of unknown function (DUF3566)
MSERPDDPARASQPRPLGSPSTGNPSTGGMTRPSTGAHVAADRDDDDATATLPRIDRAGSDGQPPARPSQPAGNPFVPDPPGGYAATAAKPSPPRATGGSGSASSGPASDSAAPSFVPPTSAAPAPSGSGPGAASGTAVMPPARISPDEQEKAERKARAEAEKKARGEAKARAAAEKKAHKAAVRQARHMARTQPQLTRRARLRVLRIDPWSVMKTSFLLSIAFGIMCVVAVFLVYSFLSAAGLWDNINSTVARLLGQRASDKFDINQYVTTSKVMGVTMLISAIDVVIITALATLGAFIYNLSASLLGGLEITLGEDQK